MYTDLPKNLRLLCSYHQSIAEVCRKLKINRPQFNRYLNGQTQPSLRLMRKLCDFFGVEEAELLLPHGQFSELVRLKPHGSRVQVVKNIPVNTVEDVVLSSRTKLDPYVGYYFTYYNSMSNPGKILRGFAQIYITPFGANIKSLENIAQKDQPEANGFTCKYEGIIYMLGDRIFITTMEMLTRNEVTHTILYPSYKNRIQYLSGIMSGVAAHAMRAPAATRIVYQFLGKSVDIRNSMKMCGLFDYGDEQIHQEIQQTLRSTLDPDRNLMEAALL
ncbi:helix-turn-helix domain-containing protein [Kiloniella sp.]|uniref:helix-turn-helix domain-containing protein n=1 Tax=Kiloniella sp. TaxID=1938587 RepID=UPI003B01691C